MESASPHQIESDCSKMIDATPLFLRTVSYNCDDGRRKTEICTLGPRHLFVLDTSSEPLVPFIDGIPYLKDKEDQVKYVQRFKEVQGMAATILIEAEIITLKEYNTYYLKNGSRNVATE
jgi:hypothetical protein